jgi:hypothetical protein
MAALRSSGLWTRKRERNGRALRDSESARCGLLSSRSNPYATDGCNSCTRRLNAALEVRPARNLQALAEDNEIRLTPERLAAAVGITRDSVLAA